VFDSDIVLLCADINNWLRKKLLSSLVQS